MQSFVFRRLIGAALAALLGLAALLPLAASADDGDPAAQEPAAGPPVARLSVVQGDVSIQRADASQPLAATVNAPLQENDYVTTGAAARGEIEFDGDSALRLDNNVQLRLINLDPAHREAQLAEGDVDVRTFHGVDGAAQIDTPSVSVRPEDAGSVRVGVTPDGQTRITVRSGRAQIFWQNGSQDLAAGTTLAAVGNPDNPRLTPIATLAYDEFDGFNRTRDANFNVAFQDPNVSDQIPGTGDLSQYGQWQSDPSYGQVWVPQTAPDWSPYTDGNWVWQPTYGYTWVSYEPWGWAPYHYGRWYYNEGWHHWAWTPPPVAYGPPRYAPALVGFVTFGSGGGFASGVAFGGVSLGFSNIGWVPLAPHEIYHPWWGARGGYGPNIVNVNIRTVYQNAYAPRGFVGVSAQAFASGTIYRHTMAYSAASITGRNATIVRGPVPIPPSSASLRYAGNTPGASGAALRPTAFAQRTFAGNRPVAQVASFSAQRAQAAAAIRESAAQEPLRELPPASTFRSSAAVPETPRSAYTPATTVRSNAATLRQAAPSDAWSRFNATRSTESAENAQRDAAPQYHQATGTTYDRGASDVNRPSYARPGTSTYTRPSSSTYTRSNPTYARPDASYNRPSGTYARPATTYARPSSTYARPAATYNRPAATYARPAASYNRPAPQQRAPQSRPAPAPRKNDR